MQNLLEKTKELCRIYDIHPARSKGQNFLVNEDVYDRLVEVADLKSDDVVLEVGPGLGFLTGKLAKAVARVVAVELDDKLADVLKTGLESQGVANVEVVNLDIMKLGSGSRKLDSGNNYNIQTSNFKLPASYKVVANLPYNISSVFLRKFLSEAENKPEIMVLMLQKEVAERIVAKPGEMSVLALSVQFYADAEIIDHVPSKDFWPEPEVDSAIIRIKLKNKNAYQDDKYEKSFFRLVKFGFIAKRKMLKNNLAAGYHIKQTEAEEKIVKAGFNPKIRAQELSVDDWKKLLGEFEPNVV